MDMKLQCAVCKQNGVTFCGNGACGDAKELAQSRIDSATIAGYEVPPNMLPPLTRQELADNESLCSHCYRTDYGESAVIHSPSGVSMCEGAFCEEAYDAYIDTYINDPQPENMITE